MPSASPNNGQALDLDTSYDCVPSLVATLVSLAMAGPIMEPNIAVELFLWQQASTTG